MDREYWFVLGICFLFGWFLADILRMFRILPQRTTYDGQRRIDKGIIRQGVKIMMCKCGNWCVKETIHSLDGDKEIWVCKKCYRRVK